MRKKITSIEIASFQIQTSLFQICTAYILTLKQKYNYRLIHGHFHIGLVIIPRPPYWPETQSRDDNQANMGTVQETEKSC